MQLGLRIFLCPTLMKSSGLHINFVIFIKVHVMSQELIFRAAMLEQCNNSEQCSNNIVRIVTPGADPGFFLGGGASSLALLQHQ